MLDFVGRADVFAALQPAIVEGYALDALAYESGIGELVTAPPADVATVRGFTLLAGDARPGSLTAGPGLGGTARFADNGVEGSALIAEDELVQLTAFPSDGGDEGGAPRRAQRINAPSRRRRG